MLGGCGPWFETLLGRTGDETKPVLTCNGYATEVE